MKSGRQSASSDAIRLYESDDHMQLLRVRREPQAAGQPVAAEHRVITACHLANVSMHLGRKIRWDPEKEQIVGDAEASQSEYVHRESRKPYTIPA